MTGNTDIIFAQPLDCYVKLTYKTRLSSIRFIKSKNSLKEKRTFNATFELEQYFSGEKKEFSCDVDISGLSLFTQKVLDELRRIKYGETITYSGLAERIGSKAYRAVGRALASNPIPIVVPCHRVVAKNGVGGYSGGVDVKKRLLELEGIH